MNIDQARMELRRQIKAGNAVLLTSRSGMGKSQLAYQEFCYLRDRDAPKGITWGFGSIFAATQTPPDLIGFSFKGERTFALPDGTSKTVTVTDPSVPLWMIDVHTGKPAFMFDKFFLLIDEYGQGEGDVKRAVAEIFLNGGTAPWYLREGSVRLACTNEGARYGVTKDFDFCIARRTKITITGDAEVTVKFLDKPYSYQGREWQTTPVMKAWMLQHPEVLFEDEPKEQGPWCNPRTACSVDRYQQIVAEESPTGEMDVSDHASLALFSETIAGTWGMPATQSYIQHLQMRIALPSYDAIVADPAGADCPVKPDYQMLIAYELAGRAKPDDMAALIKYVGRLPKDFAVTFITSLLRRDYNKFAELPAMQGWVSKNAALVATVAALSQ